MKYRQLTIEELEPLKEEFLKYLMVANITPEMWESIKKEDAAKAQNHIQTFSDLVLDKILKDILFIDVIYENRIEVYQFLKEKALVFIIENKIKDTQNLKETPLQNIDINTINITKGEKTLLKENREQEVFYTLQKQNAVISQGYIFKKVVLITVS